MDPARRLLALGSRSGMRARPSGGSSASCCMAGRCAVLIGGRLPLQRWRSRRRSRCRAHTVCTSVDECRPFTSQRHLCAELTRPAVATRSSPPHAIPTAVATLCSWRHGGPWQASSHVFVFRGAARGISGDKGLSWAAEEGASHPAASAL